MGFLGNNKPEVGRAIITIANILNIVIQNLKRKQIHNMPINLLKKPGTQSPWIDAAPRGYSDVGRNWFSCT